MPSGYPQSITAEVTSSRSAILTWEPPLSAEQNGVIVNYVVNITVEETGDMFQLFSETTNIAVSTLSPFTTYFYMIAATTIVGQGPYSVVYTLQTPEDG